LGLPYTEGGIVEILPETTLTPDTNYAITQPVKLTMGEHYTVNWNGVDYLSTATEIEGVPTLINDGANLETGEGLVFVIILADFELEPGSGMYGMISTGYGDAEAVTISVKGQGEVIHPLDGKYLPEGVPYSEGVKVVEILPETEVAVPSSGGLISSDVILDAGANYRIKYNGVDYDLTGVDLGELGAGTVAVGNLMMGGFPDTGEPFILLYNPAMGLMLMDYAASESGEDATVTVGVHCNVETLHKLDNKFIDAEWMASTKEGKGALIADKFLSEPKRHLVGGKKYIVVFDGVEYECVAMDLGDSGTIMGNLFSLGLSDTGEPFYVLDAFDSDFEGVYNLRVYDAYAGNGVSSGYAIYPVEEIPNVLPSKFMTAYVNVTVEDTGPAGVYDLPASAADKSYADIVALVYSGAQVTVKLHLTDYGSVLFLPLCEYYQGNWATFSTLFGDVASIKAVSVQFTEEGIQLYVGKI
jgi:hypothetical protein